MFALIHWGREFADQAGPREQALAALLEDLGVEVIKSRFPLKLSGNNH